jgi:NarL family two-component system response regulator LiaR
VTNVNPIRVVILDDRDIARKSLASFLENTDDFQLIGMASACKEALRLCEQLDPDMLLMNLPLPDSDEAAFMEQIGNTYPHIQIVAVTDFKDEALVRAALEVGTVGCLLNDMPATQVFVGSEVVL